MTTLFVEYEIDQPGPPVSFFVRATPKQEEWIKRLVKDNTEPWQEPYVGPVEAMTFAEFRRYVLENMEWEDPDAPAADDRDAA